MSEFVVAYKKADCISDKIKCVIARILGAHVVTPLGRIVLLPSDYEDAAKKYDIDFIGVNGK